MKQEIPPAAIIAAIVVVVLLVGFFGFKALSGDFSKAPNAPTGMTAEQKAAYENRPKGSSSVGSPQTYPSGGNGH